jgi:hypothetical protein
VEEGFTDLAFGRRSKLLVDFDSSLFFSEDLKERTANILDDFLLVYLLSGLYFGDEEDDMMILIAVADGP